MLGKTNVGGGASLNYKVVGGTAQPTSPKENTIWVNTDVKITSHIFSATQPETPVEGMVWLKTSATSVAPFNALKKNSIMVYVDGCSQYINGAWTAKNAQIYQGEWKSLAITTIYLFDGENDVTATSGGWSKWSGKGTIENDDGVIKMTAPAAQAARSNGTFGHETAVDLTGYKTVTVTTNSISSRSEDRSYVAVYDSNKTKLKSETLKKGTTSTVLDISDVTGACYVGFFVESYYSTSAYTWEAVTIGVKSVVVS